MSPINITPIPGASTVFDLVGFEATVSYSLIELRLGKCSLLGAKTARPKSPLSSEHR